MDSTRWEFWIDVGGTFTDCFARRPDGELLRGKVLSSGVTKGTVLESSRRQTVQVSGLSGAADFWRGYEFRLLDDEGNVVAQSHVTAFQPDDGLLRLGKPLQIPPYPQACELTAGEEAPILAIRQLMGLRLDQPIPSITVKLGTTRGTNALITRRGAKTALVTTRGFGDILDIGYQNRPKLFELSIKKPAPLHSAVAEIDERIGVDGTVLVAPDEEQIRRSLLALHAQGIDSLAICLLNAYAHPQHEE